MSRVGEGDVAIIPTFKGFRSTVVNEVDDTGRQAGSKFSSVFGGAIKGIGAGIAVGVGAAIAGVAVVAGKGLSRALNIQDAQAKLKGLGHDAASVTKIMESALGAVKGTAYGLDTAATVAASAVAAGIKPGKELQKYLTLTADAATIAGVSLEDMGAIINKTTSTGKVYTDNLNQLADRGIPIFQWLQDEYKVSAEDLSKMVKDGEVDAKTFRKVIEENIGGAALSSGKTARGAWANVQAALGRLGAMFTGSAVTGAPALFQSISGAVDRLATAMQPLADKFSGALTPAIAGLSGWIDRIDFGKIIGGFKGVYDLVIGGDFTSGFREAFNVEEDSGIVTFILGIRDGILALISAFQTGDFSSLGETFGAVGSIMQPLLPIFVSVAKGIGGIAATIGDLIAAGIPLLIPIIQSFTDILGFLADHSEILTPLIVGLAAGFVVFKTAQAAANVAALASVPIDAARLGTSVLNSAALFTMASATRAQTAAQGTANVVNRAALPPMLAANVQWAVNTASKIRNAVATGASRVAMLAGAVATGIATAAQWALNAAMNANPIALIVIAIAALVAGLIWFFTQTKIGQQAWAAFTQFLSEAWTNIVALFNVGMAFISGAWSAFWNVISAVGSAIFGAIVLYVKTYIGLVRAVITAVLMAISGTWKAVWNGIVSVVQAVWNSIRAVVAGGFAIVKAVISAALAVLKAIFTGDWGAIRGIISGAVDKIKGIVGGMIGAVKSAVGGIGDAIGGVKDGVMNAVAGAGSWLVDSGKAIIQGFIDGISGMIGSVGDAIGGVMDFVGGFFPHSPAKRGPFSGSGWRAVKDAGLAIGDQFGSGLDAASPTLNTKLSSLVTGSNGSRARAGERATSAGAASPSPLIGSLTLQSSGSIRNDLEETLFHVRRLARGGVYA